MYRNVIIMCSCECCLCFSMYSDSDLSGFRPVVAIVNKQINETANAAQISFTRLSTPRTSASTYRLRDWRPGGPGWCVSPGRASAEWRLPWKRTAGTGRDGTCVEDARIVSRTLLFQDNRRRQEMYLVTIMQKLLLAKSYKQKLLVTLDDRKMCIKWLLVT